MAKDGRIIVIVKHHSQPPIETQAAVWESAVEFEPETPIREVFKKVYSLANVLTAILPEQE